MMKLLSILFVLTASVSLAAPPNLLTNPGFESGLSPWLAQGGGTAGTTTSGAYAGTRCGSSTNRTTTGHGLYQSVISVATPGRMHIGSAWVRTSSSTPVTVNMIVQQNDARGTRNTTVKTAQIADQWTKIESYFLFNVNGTLTNLRLVFAGSPSGVSLFVDETSFSVFDTRAPENLLVNADLEEGTSPWVRHGPPPVTLDSAAHTGTGALLVSNRTQPWHGAEQSLMGKVEEGRLYYAAGWVSTDSATAQTVKLAMEYIDSEGSHFANIATGTASIDDWTWLSGHFKMPVTTGLTAVRLFIEGPPSGVALRGDNFYFAPLTGLRRAAVAYPALRLGAGGLGVHEFALDEKLRASVSAHFHLASTGNAMKFSNTEPADGIWTHAEADEIIAYGIGRGGTSRGHTMLWHAGLPGWVSGGTFTAPELQTLLWDQIDIKGAHYRNRVPWWDVANEAISETAGALRSTLWYDTPGIGYAANGDQYLRETFARARAADPKTALFYNDYSIEEDNTKSDAVYDMLSSFITNSVPVQGVGFQSHFSGGPSGSSVRTNFQRFNNLNLDLHVTELDFRVPVDANGIATTAELTTQGDDYFNFSGAVLGYSRLKVFQVWGIYDGDSWIPSQFSGFGQALLLDFNVDRKPAYWGVWNALAGQGEKLSVLAVSGGDSTSVTTNTAVQLSANAARRLQASAANDFMTLGFHVPHPGQWNVKIGVMRHSGGGIFQPSFAPPGSSTFTNSGTTRDTYAASDGVTVYNLGTVNFSTAGDWPFKATVTGKNAAASDFDVYIDYLRLTPVSCSPVISSVADQSIAINTALPSRLVLAEDDTAQGSLLFTATSSNTALLPNSAITLTGASPYYLLEATPAADQLGTATVTLTASDGSATSNENFLLTVTGTPLQTWRQQYFESAAETGNAADTFDNDGDGLVNLLEYATATNPNINSGTSHSATLNGSTLEFTYTKNNAATDVTYIVEWSDTLVGTWSTLGVTQALVPGSDNGTTQQWQATMPTGTNGRRFVRLRVTRL